MAKYKIDGICVTCLSAGRLLQPLQCVSVLGFDLAVSGHLCWECQAMINKMIAFQHQVKTAQQTLKTLGNCEGVTNITSLSKLSYEYIFYTDILGETEKKEVDSESENNDSNICDQEVDIKPFIQHETIDVLQNPIEIKTEPIQDSLKTEAIQESLKNEPIQKSLKIEVEDTIMEPTKDTDTNCQTIEKTREKCKLKTLTSLEEVEKIRQEDSASYRYAKGPYKCETCIISYNNSEHLERHRFELHSEKYRHECKICQQRFDSNHSKENHYNEHFTCFECVQCNYTHTRYDVVLNHYTKTHSGTVHQCKECQIVFDSIYKLKYHKRSRHAKSSKCNECGKIFATNYSLQQHMKLHKNIRWHEECPICQKKICLRRNNEMRRHLATHDASHVSRQNEKQPDKIYHCEVCQKEFKKLACYKSHMKQAKAHTQPEALKLECHDCGKRFRTKSQIRDHILRYHSRKAEYACEVCGRAFKTKNDRTTHHRIKHSGRKPVREKVCEQCGKAFFTSKTLAEHMNVHTGARPFECAVCGDTFAYSAALFNHNRLKHLGMKRQKKK